MAWYDTLLEQGYVPGGVAPKVVVEEGGKPGYYETDRFSTMNRGVEEFIKKQKETQERQIKVVEKKLDMYKTLRASGYDTQRAFNAVQKIEFPDEAPGESLEDKKTGLEIDKISADIDKTKAEAEAAPYSKGRLQAKILEKIANGEELTNGEQRIYDETMKKRGDDLDSVLGDDSSKKTRDRILSKIANGEVLTTGEQRVYDEVIRKYGNKSDIESALDKTNAKAAKENTSTRVKMTDPLGRPKLVHPDDVEKAKAAGWRLR